MSKVWGIVGWINSGKDTVAERLVNHYGFQRLSFAGPLKDAVSDIFGWDRNLLEGNTPASRRWRETRDEWWSRRLDNPLLTPRWVLQNMGTEVMRQHFHTDIWLAAVEKRIQQALDTDQNVVISDCRFTNEINMVRRTRGVLMRVDRGNQKPSWYNCAKTQNNATPDVLEYLKTNGLTMEQLWPEVHASEYNWVGVEVDHVLENCGTLDDLYNQVDQVMMQNFVNSKITD